MVGIDRQQLQRAKMPYFLLKYVCKATSILRVPESLTIPAVFRDPVQYRTQGFQYKRNLSKVYASQRAGPVNHNIFTRIRNGRKHYFPSTLLQEYRPTIDYPEVTSGDTTLREVVRSIFHKDQYEVGWIIRAPLHEEDYQDGAHYQSKYISESNYSFVHTKKRIFIVLAKYYNHYLAIPLYTHNGRGLEHKPNQDEFVYVHDKCRASREPLKQRKNGHLDAVIDPQARIPPYHPKSAAHLSHIVTRNYSLKVEFQGRLTKDSVKKLLDIAKPHLASELAFKG